MMNLLKAELRQLRGPTMERGKCTCARMREEQIAAHRREVDAWAREVKRLNGASGGFVEGPTYPVLPAFEPGCGLLCRVALESLETH